MKKLVLIILDGFGIGEMDDVYKCRSQDEGANTCVNILKKDKIVLKNLESLGLMNIINKQINGMKFSSNATFGVAKLKHYGADTFFGHQEIMGSKPLVPFTQAIKENIIEIFNTIKENGYKVRYSKGYKEKFLIVEDSLTIADNIECDLGQAFNITAALDLISFNRVLEIGKIVRKIAKVPRVITFGGREINLNNILDAVEEKEGGYIGINAPKSGVYNKGYKCIHLGYGVDANTQVTTILSEKEIPVYLLGKVADIITNTKGTSISIVDTTEVLNQTLNIIKEKKSGFICCNVQETDLAGHSQDVKKYGEKLLIADNFIGKIMDNLKDEDILIITADHGNDPTIGHNKHTREMVPIMITGKNIKANNIGKRETLSDIGATIAEFFKVTPPQCGESFLKEILKPPYL